MTTSRDCLFCGIGPAAPEAVAGLCVSCMWAVRNCELVPHAGLDGSIVLAWRSAGHLTPLGYEGVDPGTPYDPARALPADHSPEDVATVRAELVRLATGRPIFPLDREAAYLIECIRSSGVRVRLDTQDGHVVFEPVLGVPYLLLVKYLQLREHVEDELTRESAATCRDREEAARVMRARFGIYNECEGIDDGAEIEESRAEVPTLQKEQDQPAAGPVLDVLLHARG